MSSINLSVVKQKNLQTMRQNAQDITQTSERLATGKAVNSAQDNPSAFFVSSGIDSRSRDLENLMDGMQKSASHLQAGIKGIESISKLLDLAEASLSKLNTSSTPEDRARIATEYNDVLRQMEDVAKDASFDGKAMLAGPGNDLSIYLNEEAKAVLQVQAVNFADAANPDGLNLPDHGAASLGSNADLELAFAAIRNAEAVLERTAKTFAVQLSSIEDRRNFTQSLTDALNSYSVDLVVADVNEEGANLLALQTKQQLSTTSLSIANQSEEYLLQLFS
jgi:flagellin-like hook-associated protein FlgL